MRKTDMIRKALGMFALPAVLILAATGYFYLSEIRNTRAILQTKEDLNTGLAANYLSTYLNNAVADLNILASHVALKNQGITPENPMFSHLASDFLIFANSEKIYHQIRYINSQGMEVVRVNFEGGQASLVPQDQLQNKRDRYYFADTLALGPDEIFVSPLDLNVEQGAIETPYRPVIRFGKPVFNSRGEKQGIVLLNLLANPMLHGFDAVSANLTHHVMILNSDGYWIHSPDPEQEWGFMLGHDETLPKYYTKAWKQIAATEQGQFATKDGLFTFRTIHPLREGQVSSTGSSQTDTPSEKTLRAEEYFWKVVAHVPPEILNAGERSLMVKFASLDLILLTILFGGSWAMARSQAQYAATKGALKRAQARESTIVAQALDGIITIDQEGKVVQFNPACEKIFGYKARTVLGRELAELIIPLKARNKHRKNFQDHLAGGTSDFVGRTMEIKAMRADGMIFPVEISISPLRGLTHRYFTAFIRDITDRKRAEADLEIVNRTLENKVKQRTQELSKEIAEREELEKALIESNRELEQFAYVASHDLQEPIRMISSYLGLLERRYKGQLDDDANEFIGYATDGAKRMSAMIKALLDYSRVQTKGRELKPVAAGEICQDAIANLRIIIEEAGAEVITRHLPNVMADRAQLTSLFQNLIGNAIKYRSPETAPKIEVSADCSGDTCLFAVKDNGIGIDKEHHDRIFDIFQRLHGRAEFEGTGIGLALCKKIVDRHGGHIWVESENGKGSTFRFTLQPATSAVET